MSYLIEKAVIVASTDDAICVEAPEFDEDMWIPNSQVHEDSEVWKKGQEGDLVVTEWWADKKGWL